MTDRFQCYITRDLAWWRLLGGNNRSIAKAAAGFPDAQAALADVYDLAGDLADSGVELVNQAGMSWRWRLLVADRPRVVSAATYSRRIECLKSLDRFRVALAHADVPADAVVFRLERLILRSDPFRA